jgi:agmatinase
MKFDPNATGVASAGIFGLPFTFEEAQLVLLPVPWEVTTSYGNGTSLGPDAVYECSRQIDVTHADTGRAYEKGMFWLNKKQADWKALNDKLKPMAVKIKNHLETGSELVGGFLQMQEQINSQGAEFHNDVYQTCKEILQQNKLLGIVGGDHSAPFGALRALSEKYKGDFTVIHVDAHADLRKAYQGYEFSHASIMRNVMEHGLAKKLIQLGIRDYCPEEAEFIESRKDITTYYDRATKRRLAKGESWISICEDVLKQIPTQNVYFSFDIDGLNPALCPHTGTPVPGGLDYDQAIELFNFIYSHKKRIVGFDLCEVSPPAPEELDGWDGNVGSRVLYNLCCYTLASND